MNRDPSGHTEAARADRLLAGAVSGPDPLARLLAAASAPPRPDEITGEDAAVMAFRGAGRVSGYLVGRAESPVRVGARRPLWPRVLTIKAAALGLAVAAAGVALAAGTGVLPLPLVDVDSPTVERPTSVGTSSQDKESSSASAVTATGESTATNGAPSTPPDESLVGLCRAYQARLDKDPGKSIDSAAYARLVAAAGGADKVDGYCAALIADDAHIAAAQTPITGSTASP